MLIRSRYHVEGSGPPVLLLHGFGGSSTDWRDFGLLAPLRERFQVIGFDARGHGRSDKPGRPADYQLDRKIADALAVLDHLGIEQAHFYGYSHGGLMGWALGIHAARRFASMVMGGAQPYTRADPAMMGRYHAMLRYLGQGMGAYVAWREAHGTVWPASFRARMLANDSAALAAFLEAMPGHLPLEPISRMTMPVLVISGDDDELMAGSRALYLWSYRVAPFDRDFLIEVSAPLAQAGS